jgi:hypothetical protein
MGLTPEAEAWLEENCQKEGYDPCPHCGKMTKTHLKVIAEEVKDMFYENGPTLHIYLTHDGKKVKEIVQAAPWSSGPIGFLCLELEGEVLIGEWDKEEIDHISQAQAIRDSQEY